jgi:hypothetical protein
MHLQPNPSQTTPFCKIKAVNPPFRSVSTPRGTKDLPAVAAVNPPTGRGRPVAAASCWESSANRPRERLRKELSPGAGQHLLRAVDSAGMSLERLLRTGLSEVA